MSMTIAEPSIEERIQRQIDSGRYSDIGAVLSRALEILERAENLRLVRELVAEAEDDIARGDIYEGTPAFWEEVWEEAMVMDPNTPLPEHLRP